MKERVYLDTNIVLGWFKSKMRSIRKGVELKTPRSLSIILGQQKYDPVVSILVRAEIFRYLKSEWNGTENEIEYRWNEFKSKFNIIELTNETLTVNLVDISNICKKVFLGKKTIIDINHVQFAKNENLIFLTNDKKLKKRLLWYYQKIINFNDFYKAIVQSSS